LQSLLPIVETESGTRVWYALQFHGTNEFTLWDFFESDAGRNAHINGKAAAAVFASAEELFASSPDVAMFDVVAASIQL
jgi:quinol monooxygenase YgiN